MIGPNRLRNVPYIYGNLTHESKIVNPVDSFLDSVPSVLVGFGLSGEEATLEAVLVVIVCGREEHLQSNRLWIESCFATRRTGPGAKSDKISESCFATRRTGPGQSRTRFLRVALQLEGQDLGLLFVLLHAKTRNQTYRPTNLYPTTQHFEG